MSFSRAKADRVIKFFGQLKHTKGKWAGHKFELMDWQRKDIIEPLFGTIRPDGRRQYRTCYCEVTKKNGKSETAAAIALYMLTADGEMGAEVYSAAVDKYQASIVFDVAAQMVRQSPSLSKRCKIIDSVKRIVYNPTHSFYQVLSADVPTKHGLNPSCVIFDELHAQPNRDLWDVLTVGAFEARAQPILFVITTAGYDRNSVCFQQHDYSKKVLSGVIEDDSHLAVIYGLEENEDWEKEKNWIKVNPSIGVTIELDGLRREYRKAKEVPAQENMFRRMRLNQWVKSVTRWLPMDKWKKAGSKYSFGDLLGRECYGGLDLSSTDDLTAYVLVFPPLEQEDEDTPVDTRYKILPYFWLPEDTIDKRERLAKVPYQLWAKNGFLKTTPGNVIDYEFVLATIDESRTLFDVKEVAFDRWGATKISQQLDDRGLKVIPFGQGFVSMAAPTKELLKMILSGELTHNNNPVLTWMADNLVVRQDPAGNFKPDKSKSTEKIDGMVALIMAIDRAMRRAKGSVYEKRGVRAI